MKLPMQVLVEIRAFFPSTILKNQSPFNDLSYEYGDCHMPSEFLYLYT